MSGFTVDEFSNHLGDVESQSDALRISSFDSAASEIVSMLEGHESLNAFGLPLVHRHLDLPTGYAMVQRATGPDERSCRPERIGSCAIYPISYCMGNGRFAPYEFASTPMPQPTHSLLSDLARLLCAYDLQDLLALSCIEDPQESWVETMTDDLQGTVTCRSRHDIARPNGYISTEWTFTKTERGLVKRASKGCARQENGGHSRTGPLISASACRPTIQIEPN